MQITKLNQEKSNTFPFSITHFTQHNNNFCKLVPIEILFKLVVTLLLFNSESIIYYSTKKMLFKLKIIGTFLLLNLFNFKNIQGGTYGGPPITSTTTTTFTTTTIKTTTTRPNPGFFAQLFSRPRGNSSSTYNNNNKNRNKNTNKTLTYDEFIQQQAWPKGYYPIPADALTPPDPLYCPPGQRQFLGKCRSKWAKG